MRDRMDLSPDIMDALKTDILAVMSRYMTVGDEFQEFGIRRLDESVFLVSNIRVKELPRVANLN
jgi:cell division topological specificity factor